MCCKLVSSSCCVYSKLFHLCLLQTNNPLCSLMPYFYSICGQHGYHVYSRGQMIFIEIVISRNPYFALLNSHFVIEICCRQMAALYIRVPLTCPLLPPPKVLLHTVWIQVLYEVSQWRSFVGISGRKACKLTRPSETCLNLQQRHSWQKQNTTTDTRIKLLFQSAVYQKYCTIFSTIFAIIKLREENYNPWRHSNS